MSIGERIAQAREARGLTQEELARRLDIGTKSVWRWEKGTAEPRAGSLPALARELRVSLSWLLTGEHDETERLERDDDPLVRHPSLRAFIEQHGQQYRGKTLEQLKQFAAADGKAPDTPEGWKWFADRLEEALAR